jgi:ferrochelatase
MPEALDPRFYDFEARSYDALLIVSFGGPEGPDEVMPFLENVFRGLPVSDETKQKIAARYQSFGGVSPINAHTREFIGALQQLLDAEGPALPIYWGNRNWHPLLPETLSQMAGDGIRRAAAYVTSTFSSYSGCRKYREDLAAAAAGIDQAPDIDKLRIGFNH